MAATGSSCTRSRSARSRRAAPDSRRAHAAGTTRNRTGLGSVCAWQHPRHQPSRNSAWMYATSSSSAPARPATPRPSTQPAPGCARRRRRGRDRRRRPDEHHRGGELPRLPDGVMGPELMETMQKQAERFGAQVLFDDAIEVELRAGQDGRHRRRRDVPRPRRHPRDRVGLPRARPAGGEAPLRPRGLVVRDLRRLLLPQPGDRRRRRRRLSRGGGDLPHPVRLEGDDGAPPRPAPRLEDHGGPRVADPKIEFAWNSQVVGVDGDRQGHRRAAAGHGHRRGARPGRDRRVRGDRAHPAQRTADRPDRP